MCIGTFELEFTYDKINEVTPTKYLRSTAEVLAIDGLPRPELQHTQYVQKHSSPKIFKKEFFKHLKSIQKLRIIKKVSSENINRSKSY